MWLALLFGFFLLFFVLVIGFIFAIIGYTSGRSGFRIAGGVMLGIIILCTLGAISNLARGGNQEAFIYFFLIVGFLIAAVGLVFCLMSPQKNPNEAVEDHWDNRM